MRQALNNLQSAFDGFEVINSDNVFKVCDEPHPLLINQMLEHCADGEFDKANEILTSLWKCGYSSDDILVNMFRNTKSSQKVSSSLSDCLHTNCCVIRQLGELPKLEFIKEIGTSHLRAANGVRSLLQLTALLARLCETKWRQ